MFCSFTTPQNTPANELPSSTGTHKFSVGSPKILWRCIKFTVGASVFLVSSNHTSPVRRLFGIASFSPSSLPSTKISPSSRKNCKASNSAEFSLKSRMKLPSFSLSCEMPAFCINLAARTRECSRSSSQNEKFPTIFSLAAILFLSASATICALASS